MRSGRCSRPRYALTPTRFADTARQLLSLYTDRDRASADVKAIATEKLREIDRKIAELIGLRQMLGRLVEACHGDARPDCPIIDGLSGKSCGHQD